MYSAAFRHSHFYCKINTPILQLLLFGVRFDSWGELSLVLFTSLRLGHKKKDRVAQSTKSTSREHLKVIFFLIELAQLLVVKERRRTLR